MLHFCLIKIIKYPLNREVNIDFFDTKRLTIYFFVCIFKKFEKNSNFFNNLI